MPKTNWTPEGTHTITPYLVCRNAAQAIEFYKKAFGATVVSSMAMPDGKIMHAEIRIGDSQVMLSDEFPQSKVKSPQSVGGCTAGLHVYFPDVDQAFQRAVNAGATATMPPADMFWGDRYSKVSDPYGHEWGLATHVRDVSPEEMKKAADAFAKGQMTQGAS